MKAEELRSKIILLNGKMDFVRGDSGEQLMAVHNIQQEQIKLIESYVKERQKQAYPNKEADGCVFCGKCGTAI